MKYSCLLLKLAYVSLGGRRGLHLSDLPKHFTDLKVEGCRNTGSVTQTQLIDLQLNLAPGQTNTQKQLQQQAILRRDSNSTVSTYYGSMCSGDLGSSRRSSQASQVSVLYPHDTHSTCLVLLQDLPLLNKAELSGYRLTHILSVYVVEITNTMH
jgi:hypothetical protein